MGRCSGRKRNVSKGAKDQKGQEGPGVSCGTSGGRAEMQADHGDTGKPGQEFRR